MLEGSGSAAALSPQELPAARAFQMQYIALIMIVLTFIIGTFTRHKFASQPRATPAEAHPRVEPAPVWLRSTLELNDLFVLNSSSINTERADALAELLSNHDLDAEIELDTSGDYLLGIERAALLSSYFTHKGLPAEAARVYAVVAPNQAAAQARVRWQYSRAASLETLHDSGPRHD